MGNSALILLVVLVVMAAGSAYFVNSRNRQNCRTLRYEGIRINRLIKKLLLDMQQHRGMATALLNGDKSFSAKLEKKQAEIEQDIAALNALRNPALMTEKRWNDICADWQLLRKVVLTLTAEESFSRQVALVRAIVHMMGDVAERSQIVGTCSVDVLLANALWSKLPLAAEGLGQARALGSGVAAKGYCSSVARTRLRFLLGRIRETMTWVSDDLERADPLQAATMARSWQVADQAVHTFLSLLEEKIINVETPLIDAAHYFSNATTTIDTLFSVFDQSSDGMEKDLVG